jgi:hypothetical protein
VMISRRLIRSPYRREGQSRRYFEAKYLRCFEIKDELGGRLK